VLGILSAFKDLGWEVKTFIVGDRVPVDWIKKGSEDDLRRSSFRILLADILRVAMGFVNARKAFRELGQDVNWVYERLATLQSLGWMFKKHGKLWILETNAPLFIEAKSDRETIVLDRLAKYLELKAYQDCDILVCISDTLKQIIVEHTAINPQKVVVVPNGVDVAVYDPDMYKPIRLFDGFTVGFVGNLASWQGLDLLIDVISELRQDGLDIYLVVVGDGVTRQELEERVQRLDMEQFVKFIGFVPRNQVAEYIAGFDVGYSGQTQRTESRMYCSPIKIYEYMAMGVPAIASDYEDTRRVIQDGTGFLFRIDSMEDLKKAVIHAYSNRKLLPIMGRKAREEIQLNQSWVARVEKLITAIEQYQNSH
jgi:glycosyltransferase involved in cell wall biosynthesis